MDRSNAGSVLVTLTFRCSRQSRIDHAPSRGCRLSCSSVRPETIACPSDLIASICLSIDSISALMIALTRCSTGRYGGLGLPGFARRAGGRFTAELVPLVPAQHVELGPQVIRRLGAGAMILAVETQHHDRHLQHLERRVVLLG